MSHEVKQIITVHRNEKTQSPVFTFKYPARIDTGRVILFTEGSDTLKATLTIQAPGNDTSSVYEVFMPDSYQNFTLLDIPDVEVAEGTTIEFGVTEENTTCTFELVCYAHDWLQTAETVAVKRLMDEEGVVEPELPVLDGSLPEA